MASDEDGPRRGRKDMSDDDEYEDAEESTDQSEFHSISLFLRRSSFRKLREEALDDDEDDEESSPSQPLDLAQSQTEQSKTQHGSRGRGRGTFFQHDDRAGGRGR